MDNPVRFQIQPICRDHDRSRFDCGHPFLNEYLRQFARQNSVNGVARAYVLVEEGDTRVLGYYTLSATAVGFEHIPPKVRRRLPKYPVPAARIGELAVDGSQQGKGIGSLLLLDAMERITAISEEFGIWAVIVDPIDQQAANFYRHFGFEPLTAGDALFLTIRDLMIWLE